MKRFIFVLALLPVLLTAKWVKTFDHGGNEVGKYVLERSDGSMMVLGEVGFEDSTALFLDKFDAGGNLIWHRLYDGYRAWMVLETDDGGFAISGVSRYDSEPDSIVFVKTNPDGSDLWSRNYPGRDELIPANGSSRDVDGGYTILSDIFIRIDTLGDTAYTRTYDEFILEGMIGKCSLTDDGGYVMYNYWQPIGCQDNSYPQHYPYLTKLDTEGEVEWIDSLIHIGMYFLENISQGHEGTVFIGSNWDVDSNWDPIHNTRITEWSDPDGSYPIDQLWDTRIGDFSVNEIGTYIEKATGFSYIATGKPRTIFKLSGNGDLLWSREIAGEGHFVTELTDGGFIVTGALNGDLMLVKTDSLGYVGIEDDIRDEGYSFDLEMEIGPEIVLRYKDLPDGFRATVFNSSGRKVDQINSDRAEGTVTWGSDAAPGVYFIIPDRGRAGDTRKVIIVR